MYDVKVITCIWIWCDFCCVTLWSVNRYWVAKWQIITAIESTFNSWKRFTFTTKEKLNYSYNYYPGNKYLVHVQKGPYLYSNFCKKWGEIYESLSPFETWIISEQFYLFWIQIKIRSKGKHIYGPFLMWHYEPRLISDYFSGSRRDTQVFNDFDGIKVDQINCI